MALEKYAFIGLAVLAVAFVVFVFLGGNAQGISAHQIDGNAQATYEPPSQQAGGVAPSGSQAGGAPAGAVQEVSLTATSSGYDKAEIHVKAGVPVHFTFTAIGAGCCAQLLIDRVGVQLISRGTAVDATFTPPTPGSYPYHCGMNMCRGVLIAE